MRHFSTFFVLLLNISSGICSSSSDNLNEFLRSNNYQSNSPISPSPPSRSSSSNFLSDEAPEAFRMPPTRARKSKNIYHSKYTEEDAKVREELKAMFESQLMISAEHFNLRVVDIKGWPEGVGKLNFHWGLNDIDLIRKDMHKFEFSLRKEYVSVKHELGIENVDYSRFARDNSMTKEGTNLYLMNKFMSDLGITEVPKKGITWACVDKSELDDFYKPLPINSRSMGLTEFFKNPEIVYKLRFKQLDPGVKLRRVKKRGLSNISPDSYTEAPKIDNSSDREEEQMDVSDSTNQVSSSPDSNENIQISPSQVLVSALEKSPDFPAPSPNSISTVQSLPNRFETSSDLSSSPTTKLDSLLSVVNLAVMNELPDYSWVPSNPVAMAPKPKKRKASVGVQVDNSDSIQFSNIKSILPLGPPNVSHLVKQFPTSPIDYSGLVDIESVRKNQPIDYTGLVDISSVRTTQPGDEELPQVPKSPESP